MDAPDNGTHVEFKVSCDQHGLVQDEIQDWIAADLVLEEHLEQCPGPARRERVESVERDTGYQTAAERIAEKNREKHEHGVSNHCPKCHNAVEHDLPTECSRCGSTIVEDQDGHLQVGGSA